MKTRQLLLLLLGLQSSFYSCKNTMVGIGFTQNQGNLQLIQRSNEEDKQNAIGGFLESRWKKMNGMQGLGIDYNFLLRGYGSSYSDGGDTWIQTIQGKYYYRFLNDPINKGKLDLSFGLGIGNYFLGSNLPFPVTSTIALDFYFPNNEKLYLTLRTGYLIEFKDYTQNYSLGIGIGMRFKED